jgi:predicted methyltransferase
LSVRLRHQEPGPGRRPVVRAHHRCECETETFHRIDEKALRDEVEAAGFKLAGEASFLRNPSDTRDWNDSPRASGDKRGTSDRFVLKFEKP